MKLYNHILQINNYEIIKVKIKVKFFSQIGCFDFSRNKTCQQQTKTRLTIASMAVFNNAGFVAMISETRNSAPQANGGCWVDDVCKSLFTKAWKQSKQTNIKHKTQFKCSMMHTYWLRKVFKSYTSNVLSEICPTPQMFHQP